MKEHRGPEFARVRLALGASAVLGGLPTNTLDAMAAAARIERPERGSMVGGAYQPRDMLWHVLEGGLTVYWLAAGGDPIPIAIVNPGSFYNVASFFDDVRPALEARAERGTVLAAIPGSVLRDLASKDPALSMCLARILFQRFLASQSFFVDALYTNLGVRLARRLLGQAMAVRNDMRAEIELSVSQTSLAALVGASRPRVNAELRRIEQQGLIRLGYGKIYVRDIERLAQFAGGPGQVF